MSIILNNLKQDETNFGLIKIGLFDCTAEKTGTGDRSEFKLETVLESNV